MVDPIAPAAPVVPAPAAAPAAEPAADISLLDPSHDDTGKGGAGGSDPSAAAKAAADAAAAAKAGGKGDGQPKPGDGKGAPEKYVEFTVPKGVTLDPVVVTEFQAVAKELGLTQESAQKLVDFQSKVSLTTVEQKMKEFNDMKKGWEDATIKELGANYQAERALVAKARDKFVTPDLQKLLNESGMGSHPEIFKMFAKLGKAIAEDNLADGKPAGGGNGPQLIPTSEVLFGKTTPPKK